MIPQNMSHQIHLTREGKRTFLTLQKGSIQVGARQIILGQIILGGFYKKRHFILLHVKPPMLSPKDLHVF